MSEESCELLHLHKLPAGGAKPLRLKKRCGENKGLVVPEPNGVSHGRVPVGEKLLELVSLEEISDGEIATVLRPSLTLPPFVAHLLSFDLLDQRRRRRDLVVEGGLHGGYAEEDHHRERGRGDQRRGLHWVEEEKCRSERRRECDFFGDALFVYVCVWVLVRL